MTRLPYFPFSGEPYKIQMGLKNLDLADWLERDETRPEQLQKKIQLLSERKTDVLYLQPQVESACLELNETVREFGLKYWPDSFKGDLKNLTVDGIPYDSAVTGEQAMKQLASWVQEDFVIMSGEPPATLIAALLCFPSRWKLADKAGRQSDQIHAPVPQFSQIAKTTAIFLDRVQVDKPMWRTNWSIHDSDELFSQGGHKSEKVFKVESVLHQTFLRVERQTLRRLPQTKQIIFTIRTYIHRMDQVVDCPERRNLLKKTLVSLAPEVASYRGMSAFLDVLVLAL